jgi:hypothetical protein
MVTQIIGTSAPQQTHFYPRKTSAASCLGLIQRKELSLQVLARNKSVSFLAQNYRVSREWRLLKQHFFSFTDIL